MKLQTQTLASFVKRTISKHILVSNIKILKWANKLIIKLNKLTNTLKFVNDRVSWLGYIIGLWVENINKLNFNSLYLIP